MSVLINGHNLEHSFSGRDLFSKLSFGIESGERIGMIGPNGAGKSTLMRIICGRIKPDGGTLSRKQGLNVAYLEQSPELDPELAVSTTILQGAFDPHDWEAMSQMHDLFSKFGFEKAGIAEDTLIKELSGGWRKKVALCRELLRNPEILLLDEPTNHLDVESILWLEEFLATVPFATLTITHDRLFLNRISNRIWELDRRNTGGLLKITGDYATYCEVKEQQLATLQRREDTLQNTLRRETEWLRRGPKARTTKQSARIDRAYELADEVSNLEGLNKNLKVGIQFDSADGAPKKLIEAKKISKSYGDRVIIKDFSLLLERGRRIGLIGANGAGKSTLIRVLLGLEAPDSGVVEHSEKLEVAYFAQNRDLLDPTLTVLKTICPQGDHVKFRGNFIHIRSYMDRFLFNTQQLDSPVAKLSGGEQARLLIAKLMLTQANVLVLDEPTNDLDLQTLNILEERLKDFEGAIILVTHDRYFLDQVADQVYAFNNGKLENFEGVGQWEEWAKNLNIPNNTQAKVVETPKVDTSKKTKKLTYNDQRELDMMEETIRVAEEKLLQLSEESIKPEHSSNSKKLAELAKEMGLTQAEIDRLYKRWSELEAMKG